MVDRKELKTKYGEFSGLDSVYHEFDPVNNPSINPAILESKLQQTPLSRKSKISRRTPSLPSMRNSNLATLSSARSKRGLWMSQKFKGKNFRTRDINTKLKLNPIYNRFNKMNLESDKYFYPNPTTLIHPLKDTRNPNFTKPDQQQNLVQSELISGNLYAPQTTKAKKKFRIRKNSRRSMSQNSNKRSLSNKISFN